MKVLVAVARSLLVMASSAAVFAITALRRLGVRNLWVLRRALVDRTCGVFLKATHWDVRFGDAGSMDLDVSWQGPSALSPDSFGTDKTARFPLNVQISPCGSFKGRRKP